MKNKKVKFIELLMGTEREGIEDVIEYLEQKTDFFTAPASTRFHLSCEGGLMQHSINVYKNFKKINLDVELRLSKSTVILCALLHDVCKINTYKDNILKTTKKRSTTKPYNYYDSFPIGHGDKSVAILLGCGLKLSEKEQMIIRWHMGPFDYNYKNYQNDVNKHCKESQYLFIADYLSTLGEGKNA